MTTVTYTITISANEISISPAISGVAIEGHYNSDMQYWSVNDGSDSETCATVNGAVEAVKNMVDYFASEDGIEANMIEVWETVNTLAEVMTAAEACEVYGLAEATVRQAINRGTVPARKSAETWLVLRADCEARWGKKKATFTYCAKPLWDLTPSEYEGEITKYVADLDKAYGDVIVNVVAPKGYELVEDDFARIEELINEK